jgi:hypothetical protein
MLAERLPPGDYNALAALGFQDPSGSGEPYAAVPLQRKLEFQVGAARLAPPERAAPAPRKAGEKPGS